MKDPCFDPAAVSAHLVRSLEQAARGERPFTHWIARSVFPAEVLAGLKRLPLPAAPVDGISGKRELHNDSRRYFDSENNARFPACGAVASAFQSEAVTSAIEAATGADLSGTYVRLEYAQDLDGFWLEPHTDLGVKRFTMLIYLNDGGQDELGTDLFHPDKSHAARTPFEDNSALIFVPGDDTWHGLARRTIAGVRRSVIMNYVTDEWRARDQLAFQTPVRAAGERLRRPSPSH